MITLSVRGGEPKRFLFVGNRQEQGERRIEQVPEDVLFSGINLERPEAM